MLPSERQYFYTGDAVFEERIPLLVLIPKSQVQWVYFTFFGLLGYAADLASWATGGETTPEEAVDIFTTVWETARPMLFLIGMINDFAAPVPDGEGWLQCDGTAYDPADWPDLFTAIGTTYNTGGEPSGFFRVPDLRGRTRATVNSGETRLPSFADTAGGTGGESDHTLIVSEMPSHSHTDTGHVHTEGTAAPAVGAAIVGVPIPSAIPSVGVTGSGNASLTDTGGDAAHNNVQPTMALYTYILASF